VWAYLVSGHQVRWLSVVVRGVKNEYMPALNRNTHLVLTSSSWVQGLDLSALFSSRLGQSQGGIERGWLQGFRRNVQRKDFLLQTCVRDSHKCVRFQRICTVRFRFYQVSWRKDSQRVLYAQKSVTGRWIPYVSCSCQFFECPSWSVFVFDLYSASAQTRVNPSSGRDLKAYIWSRQIWGLLFVFWIFFNVFWFNRYNRNRLVT
jgi:hypothetical protein